MEKYEPWCIMDMLQHVKGLVDSIIADMCRTTTPGLTKEAINWGDLKCTEVASVTTDKGLTLIRVLIEEADPSATELQRYIESALYDKGWTNVEVRTEW